MTIKQAAEIMNVSERTVRMAGELMRTGRTDLEADIMAGRLSIHGALKIAKPEKYRRQICRLTTLKREWRAATEAEQLAFLDSILGEK